MYDVSQFKKAIVAGIVSAVVALAARYGFQPDPATVTALGVIVTAVVGYAVAHISVYFAKNKVV